MAALSAPDVARVRQAFTREVNGGESMAATRPDLLAAIEALDAWLDGNAATVNAALPQPARTALTNRQKARLLSAVVRRRFEVS
jgi:hypothetical protein